MSLADEIVASRLLYEGKEIGEEEIPELSRSVLIRRARERLLYALDRRLHSEKELREKLKRDYPPEIIDAAINELDSLGLINDEAFARAFCENRKESLKKWPYAIRQELILKGVSRDIIDAVLDEAFCDEDDELELAKIVARKYQNDLDTPKGRQRLFAALTRRGFSYTVIKMAMRALCDEIIED